MSLHASYCISNDKCSKVALQYKNTCPQAKKEKRKKSPSQLMVRKSNAELKQRVPFHAK